MSRATMRDVAGQAGVSLQTVSNYVNGRFNLMSAETRERVGRELDRLGYWPNAAARSLRAKRTMTLGFLVLDEGARFLADPMTDLIIAGIGDVARDNGYALLIQAARPDPDDADRL
ncbi:MAG TPA: LacI family DNA-binding transcriptional regulator, partial [Gaiellaceae bacterium]|nr:LacI family DNA-binding transcriptional regulator [Gaiellaceae bacterium]